MPGKPVFVTKPCAVCGGDFTSNKYKRAKVCSPVCNGIVLTRRATERMPSRFYAKVNKLGRIVRPELGHCWEWTGHRDRKGYGHVGYGRKQTTRAHRLAWFIERGKWPEPCCLHRCDNPSCVRIEHLFEGTIADNTHDMIAKGRDRHLAGSENGRARLSEGDVREIRRRLCLGEQQAALASEFGVSRTALSQLARGLTWKRVA